MTYYVSSGTLNSTNSTELKILGEGDSSQDRHRVLRASIFVLPRDWKRRPGRPSLTWLRTVEKDSH